MSEERRQKYGYSVDVSIQAMDQISDMMEQIIKKDLIHYAKRDGYELTSEVTLESRGYFRIGDDCMVPVKTKEEADVQRFMALAEVEKCDGVYATDHGGKS